MGVLRSVRAHYFTVLIETVHRSMGTKPELFLDHSQLECVKIFLNTCQYVMTSYHVYLPLR